MPKRQKHDRTIQQQLIDEITESGLSQNKLAELSGVAQPNLNAFINGKRGLSLNALNGLCQVLQLKLIKKRN